MASFFCCHSFPTCAMAWREFSDNRHKIQSSSDAVRHLKALHIPAYHSQDCWSPIHNLIQMSANFLSCTNSSICFVTSDTNWINCSAIQVLHAAWHSPSGGIKHQQTQPDLSIRGKMTYYYYYYWNRRNKMYIFLSKKWKLLSKKSNLIKSWWTVTSHISEREHQLQSTHLWLVLRKFF